MPTGGGGDGQKNLFAVSFFFDRAIGVETILALDLLLLGVTFPSSSTCVMKFVDTTRIVKWLVVDFSARCVIRNLVDLIKCGGIKGIRIDEPFDVFEESIHNRRALHVVRVDKIFDFIQSKLPSGPQFFACSQEEKIYDLYGPWKKKPWYKEMHVGNSSS